MKLQLPVYLDHNATTPLHPAVLEEMLPYLREHHGNALSGHFYGKNARAGVELARERVAHALGCSPDEILFTSGGTEANNLALRGLTEALESDARHEKRRTIVTSAIEHPSVSRPCAWLARRGWRVVAATVNERGQLDADRAREEIGELTAVVSVMHANNETGVLQPIGDLARLAKERGAFVHSDAAQSLGKVPVRVDDLGLDLLSIAGHKLYAPKGVGALVVRRGTPLVPLLLGAGHERGLRPGTENVAAIVGLGMACELVTRDLEIRAASMARLRDRLWQRLCDRVPHMRLNGEGAERLPNTLNVRFPGVSATRLLAATSEVAASTGSACHDGHESPSAVLLAMGIPADEAIGSARLTLGMGTTEAEIDHAAAVLANAWRTLERPIEK